MSGNLGFDLLAKQTAEFICDRIQLWCEYSASEKDFPGDTPIERLLIGSILLFEYVRGTKLYTQFKKPGGVTPPSGVAPPSAATREDLEATFFSKRKRDILLCTPQAEIDGVGRVDFLFQCRLSSDDKIRKLIVECDGHDFHERTKEQAANDRARDRSATLLGYQVFRFTGSELWADPLGCARQVIKWAEGK